MSRAQKRRLQRKEKANKKRQRIPIDVQRRGKRNALRLVDLWRKKATFKPTARMSSIVDLEALYRVGSDADQTLTRAQCAKRVLKEIENGIG